MNALSFDFNVILADPIPRLEFDDRCHQFLKTFIQRMGGKPYHIQGCWYTNGTFDISLKNLGVYNAGVGSVHRGTQLSLRPSSKDFCGVDKITAVEIKSVGTSSYRWLGYCMLRLFLDNFRSTGVNYECFDNHDRLSPVTSDYKNMFPLLDYPHYSAFMLRSNNCSRAFISSTSTEYIIGAALPKSDGSLYFWEPLSIALTLSRLTSCRSSNIGFGSWTLEPLLASSMLEADTSVRNGITLPSDGRVILTNAAMVVWSPMWDKSSGALLQYSGCSDATMTPVRLKIGKTFQCRKGIFYIPERLFENRETIKDQF